MELLSNLSDSLLFFLPGFVCLKVFYVLGLKTTRTDLEWAVWSVMSSVLLFPATVPLRSMLGLGDTSAVARAILILFAFLVGSIGATTWNRVVAPRWRWRFVAEPWDLAYYDAVANKLQVAIELADGREAVGDMIWMGLVGEGSSRSITLGNVQISDGAGVWTKLDKSNQLHIPEASIGLLRLVPFTSSDS